MDDLDCFEAVPTLQALGDKALEERNFSLAVELFTAAIEQTPSDPTLYVSRALAHLMTENPTPAALDASAAIKMDPQCVRSYVLLGTALMQLGRYAGAVAAYKMGLDVDPENSALANGLAAAEQACAEEEEPSQPQQPENTLSAEETRALFLDLRKGVINDDPHLIMKAIQRIIAEARDLLSAVPEDRRKAVAQQLAVMCNKAKSYSEHMDARQRGGVVDAMDGLYAQLTGNTGDMLKASPGFKEVVCQTLNRGIALMAKARDGLWDEIEIAVVATRSCVSALLEAKYENGPAIAEFLNEDGAISDFMNRVEGAALNCSQQNVQALTQAILLLYRATQRLAVSYAASLKKCDISCAKCSMPLDTTFIPCLGRHGCQKFYHRTCVGVPASAFECAEWYCNIVPCDAKAKIDKEKAEARQKALEEQRRQEEERQQLLVQMEEERLRFEEEERTRVEREAKEHAELERLAEEKEKHREKEAEIQKKLDSMDEFERKKYLLDLELGVVTSELNEPEPTVILAKAKFDYELFGAKSDDLSFKEGDIITILDRSGDNWRGRIGDREGVFPSSFVDLYDPEKEKRKREEEEAREELRREAERQREIEEEAERERDGARSVGKKTPREKSMGSDSTGSISDDTDGEGSAVKSKLKHSLAHVSSMKSKLAQVGADALTKAKKEAQRASKAMAELADGKPINTNVPFVNIEDVHPTASEKAAYAKVAKLLKESESILKEMGAYQGADQEIRAAISKNTATDTANLLQTLTPLAKQLQRFFIFATNLESCWEDMLLDLCGEPVSTLPTKPALLRQLAEVYQFCLQADETKKLKTCFQNDFSHYRRLMARQKMNSQDAPVLLDDTEANHMSLFYAYPCPFFKVLVDTTARLIRENKISQDCILGCCTAIHNLSLGLAENPEVTGRLQQPVDTTALYLHLAVGSLLLYDHTHPTGVFTKKSPMDARQVIRALLRRQNHSTWAMDLHTKTLLNALRYNTRHIGAQDTNPAVRQMLDL
eukprot:comp6811_c0_seq1/m.2554 comp6811_c0_seq1/g.2554  ORF comp6811_c0_seq1/g.2554 comp6811_c0_seq1/m.2554 type:complete len:1003 (-) comp6811_c0_seq1:311-3319(-)